MYKYLSKAPLALAHTDTIYADLIRYLNELIDSHEPEPFEFESIKTESQEIDRFIIPLAKQLRAEPIATLLRKWTLNHLPVFLEHLRETVLDPSFIFNRSKTLRMYLRFRVFQDRNGYSLAPHKDSEDTLFAFLLQLSEENPTTSLFFLNPKLYKVKIDQLENKNSSDIEKLLRAFLNEAYGAATAFKLSENRFGEPRFIAWDEHRSVWMASLEDRELIISKYDEQNLKVPYGSLLALHNPRGDYAFSSQTTKFIRGHCAHGFFPSKFEKRNLLLFDLMCTEVSDEEKMRPNPDRNPDHEYFIFLRSDTNQEILNRSGFI